VPGALTMGMGITLPFEDGLNPYVSEELAFEFHYFFTRKFWMVYHCQVRLTVSPPHRLTVCMLGGLCIWHAPEPTSHRLFSRSLCIHACFAASLSGTALSAMCLPLCRALSGGLHLHCTSDLTIVVKNQTIL